MELRLRLMHHRNPVVHHFTREAILMRARILFLLAVALSFPFLSFSQVTHGQKPNLPPPYATESAGNGPGRVKPPAGFLPTVPAGFQVNIFAKDFKVPRWLTVAPNGDIFLANTGAGEIIVLRDPQKTGGAQDREVFVGNHNELLRFRYDPKTSKRLGEKEHLLDLPSGGHDTRTLAFSADGKHL